MGDRADVEPCVCEHMVEVVRMLAGAAGIQLPFGFFVQV